MSPSRSVFLPDPPWWYEPYGVADWLQTLFNQPIEVHAFFLGAFVGVLFAYLSIDRRPRAALGLTLGVLLFTFGVFQTVVVCSGAFSACQHVRLKPWYFLAGYLTSYALLVGAVGQLTTRSTGSVITQLLERRTPADSDRTGPGWLSGLIVVLLAGLAGYSFVSPTPVHPITGLATIGGLIGAAVGLAGYEWAVSDPEAEAGLVATARRVLGEERRDSILVVAYGGVLGFGYPRLFWTAGQMTGREGFLIDPIIWPQPGLASVMTYVSALFLVSVGLTKLRLRERDQRLDGRFVAALVFGYGLYAVVLYLLTGYAGMVWYRLIPAASIP